MGLDMYLIRRKKGMKELAEDWYDNGDEVMYWRKANQIHKWFVDNVQDGVDDCGEYIVSEAKIEELRDICKELIDNIILKKSKVKNGYTLENDGNGGFTKVYNYEDGEIIENKEICERLLPATEGFFFGSIEYDQWYYQNIVDTYEKFEKILEEFDFTEYDLIYHSSW